MKFNVNRLINQLIINGFWKFSYFADATSQSSEKFGMFHMNHAINHSFCGARMYELCVNESKTKSSTSAWWKNIALLLMYFLKKKTFHQRWVCVHTFVLFASISLVLVPLSCFEMITHTYTRRRKWGRRNEFFNLRLSFGIFFFIIIILCGVARREQVLISIMPFSLALLRIELLSYEHLENGLELLFSILFFLCRSQVKTEIYAKFLSKCNRQNYALNVEHSHFVMNTSAHNAHITYPFSVGKSFCIWKWSSSLLRRRQR